MNNLTPYFEIIDYAVFATFFLILFEFSYSMIKKDGAYTIRGTVGNLLNALIMKTLPLYTVTAFYISYLAYVIVPAPHIHTITNHGAVSYMLCIILIDFSAYWYHRALHRFRILWAFHFVHHSDDTLNLSTSYRFSLIEKFYNTVVIVPAVLLGFHPLFAFLCFYGMSLYQFFTHSGYISYPKILDPILITPSNHRLHHDQAFVSNGRNFGGVFSVWDILFGTYKKPTFSITPGIPGYHQNNVIKMQTEPLFEYLKEIYRSLLPTGKK